ncbi:hypothetical protein SDC9_78010 [bioreactor metagenome]|uniref:Uncharacterized protein n=1 Tax=bioreactor metagenome TaxID=1076179 RepID=A0A644YS92_9ZZZZ
MEERDPAFAGYRFRQQSLSGTRRTNKQHPAGYLCPDFGEVVRVLEERNHFLQFVLGLNLPGHILERGLGVCLHVFLGFALAQAGHHLSIEPTGLTVKHDGKANKNYPRKELENNLQKRDLLHRARNRNAFSLQGGEQILIKIGNPRLSGDTILEGEPDQGLLFDLHLQDLP